MPNDAKTTADTTDPSGHASSATPPCVAYAHAWATVYEGDAGGVDVVDGVVPTVSVAEGVALWDAVGLGDGVGVAMTAPHVPAGHSVHPPPAFTAQQSRYAVEPMLALPIGRHRAYPLQYSHTTESVKFACTVYPASHDSPHTESGQQFVAQPTHSDAVQNAVMLVAVADMDADAEREGVGVCEGVIDGVAPTESDAEGVRDAVAVREGVRVGHAYSGTHAADAAFG